MVIIRIARGGAGGVCPNAIKDNQNNDFNAFFQDIDGIAVPANPAAGHRRLFVDTADGVIKVRTPAGVTTSLEAGAGGGEINTLSSSGLGTSDLSAVPSKVALDLRVKTLSVSADLSKTDAANLITLGLQNLPVLGTLPASPRQTSITTAEINDNAITLAKMASGTDGNLITYDACGNPAAVATGTAAQVLTSNGAGAAPTFQAGGGGAGKTFAVIIKKCDTSRTCCVTPSADPELKFAATANKKYGYAYQVALTGFAAGDIKFQMSAPAGATGKKNSGAVNHSLIGSTLCFCGLGCGCTNGFVQTTTCTGFIEMGACAGCISFNWSQKGSSACATVVKAGSKLIAWECCA